MAIKLPVVGKRYRRKKTYFEQPDIFYKVIREGMSASGMQWVWVEELGEYDGYSINVRDFWDFFEELPENTSEPEVNESTNSVADLLHVLVYGKKHLETENKNKIEDTLTYGQAFVQVYTDEEGNVKRKRVEPKDIYKEPEEKPKSIYKLYAYYISPYPDLSGRIPKSEYDHLRRTDDLERFFNCVEWYIDGYISSQKDGKDIIYLPGEEYKQKLLKNILKKLPTFCERSDWKKGAIKCFEDGIKEIDISKEIFEEISELCSNTTK